MKRKIGLFCGLLLGIFAIGGACISINRANSVENAIVAHAEGDEDPVDPQPEEVFECSVVLGTYEHGKISVDKEEGHVGEVVTITAKHDLCYIAEFVSVNGTNLVESSEISGKYTFTLVEGENKIAAKFIVDEALLGEMSVIFKQASNKDWTALFSVENVIRIVAVLLQGGLLLAIIRYFVKDKRLEKKIENKVGTTLNTIVPETTKQVILENTKQVLQPVFSEITSYQVEIIRVVGVLIKCVALAQENTPEARMAILAELSNLNIGDQKVISDAKAFIDKYFAEKTKELNDVLSSLDNIIDKNKEVVDKAVQISTEESVEKNDKATEEEKKEETIKTDEKDVEIEDDGTQF